MSPPRSALYVPATRLALLDKALDSGADQVILDLEDAVPAGRKDEARAEVADRLGAPGATPVWVRLNPGAAGVVDVEGLAGAALAGLSLAKAESAEEVRAVSEAAVRATGRQVPIEPLVESARAVLRAEELAIAPGVVRLQLGETDLAADLGAAESAYDEGLAYARSRVVVVSAAHGLRPPMAPVDADFRDLERFEASTRRLAGMGFVGRVCIHPAQVEVANRVFTPEPAAVERAAALLAEVEAHAAAGTGAFVGADGRMVDAAHVRGAARVLALAGGSERMDMS